MGQLGGKSRVAYANGSAMVLSPMPQNTSRSLSGYPAMSIVVLSPSGGCTLGGTARRPGIQLHNAISDAVPGRFRADRSATRRPYKSDVVVATDETGPKQGSRKSCRIGPAKSACDFAPSRLEERQSRSRTRTASSGSAANSVIRMASRRNTRSASLVGCAQRRSHTTLGGGPIVVASS